MAGNNNGNGDDNPDNGFRGLMRGLRDLVTQIADPTASPRPQPVSSPGRRPPRASPRAVTANSAGAREPLVDVYDEGAFIRVVADMPGADPATVRVRGVDDRLSIVASGPARRYERLLTLPAPVHPERAEPPTFINGIMEILLPAERPTPAEEVPETAVALPDATSTDGAVHAANDNPAAIMDPTGQYTIIEER